MSPQPAEQPLFLALTVIIIIIIILISKDTTTTISVIALAVSFYTLCGCADKKLSAKTQDKNSAPQTDQATTPKTEEFWPLPDEPAPYAIQTKNPPHHIPPHYKGAIDVDIQSEYESGAKWGHRDRTAYETGFSPLGNPFDTDRIAYPAALGPCIDDEAHGANIDGDELNVYHARSRNDNTRVIAGTIRRKEFMDRFLREELEEEEDSRWWGRHEW